MAGGESREENITMQYVMLYVYKIVRLIVLAVVITYFIGCAWWGLCTQFDKEVKGPSFEHYNKESFYAENDKKNHVKALIVSCYFALATLSTVGYGDFYPISNIERIIAVIIMLGGVAFFSYIMGNFIEIL